MIDALSMYTLLTKTMRPTLFATLPSQSEVTPDKLTLAAGVASLLVNLVVVIVALAGDAEPGYSGPAVFGGIIFALYAGYFTFVGLKPKFDAVTRCMYISGVLAIGATGQFWIAWDNFLRLCQDGALTDPVESCDVVSFFGQGSLLALLLFYTLSLLTFIWQLAAVSMLRSRMIEADPSLDPPKLNPMSPDQVGQNGFPV